MPGAPRPAVRVLSVVFALAVVGGLIGIALERLVYRAPVESEDPLDPVAPRQDPLPPVQHTHSAWEESILSRTLSHFPPYPRGTRPEVLAADYLGDQVPIAAVWFSTRDTPAQVLSHYTRGILDAGLPVLSQPLGERGGYVGYWSPSSEEVHLVSVLAQGNETLVFVSSGQMASLAEGTQRVPEWIPLPVQARHATALSFRLEGATQYTVTARVPESDVAQGVAFFREAFGKQGWSVEEPVTATDSGAQLQVRRGAVFGMVMLHRRPPVPEVSVYLTLTERMNPPQMGSAEDKQ